MPIEPVTQLLKSKKLNTIKLSIKSTDVLTQDGNIVIQAKLDNTKIPSAQQTERPSKRNSNTNSINSKMMKRNSKKLTAESKLLKNGKLGLKKRNSSTVTLLVSGTVTMQPTLNAMDLLLMNS
jgi:hypothetical protein